MSRSVEKLGSLVFSVLMVTSMFVGVVALSGTAAAAGNLAFDSASPNSASPGETVDGQELTFSVDVQDEDGNSDTVSIEFADEDFQSLSPNSASTSDSGGTSSSVQLVDGPDNDGNADTLQFGLSDAGPGTITFTVNTGVTYDNPDDGDLDVNVTFEDSAGSDIQQQTFDGVVDLGSGSSGAGNANDANSTLEGATPDSVATGDTVENQQIRFALNNFTEDGNSDTVFVAFNESTIDESSLSPNTALTNDSDGVSQSIEVVDGPDEDGTRETLRFGLSNLGPDPTSVGVDTTVTYTDTPGAVDTNLTVVDSAGLNSVTSQTFTPVLIQNRTLDSGTLGGNVLNPAEDPLPRGSTDNTQSSPFAAGGSVEVANVSFDTPGTVRNVSVNVSGGANGNVDPEAVTALEVTLLDNNNERLESERVPYPTGETNATVDFGSNVSDVETVVARASLDENVDRIDDTDTIDALLTTQVNNSVFRYDTLTTQRSANRTGSLAGDVTDSNNNRIGNATVTAVLQTGTYRQNVSTSSNGRYNFGPPTARTLPASTNYEFRATKPGFSVDVGERSTIENNRTTTQDFLLDPLLVPVEIEVDPDEDSALVGQNNTFTATVTDQNGNVLPDVEVEATADSSDIEFLATPDTGADGDGDNSTAVTDANGQAVFVVTSDTVVVSDIEFEAINGSGPNPTDTSTKSFVQNGEGSIQGTILNDATTDPVEDASVWAVLENRFRENTQETAVNLDGNTTITTTTTALEYTQTVSSGNDGNSLNGIEIDDNGTGADFSNVDQEDVTVFLNGADVSDDIDGASESDGGTTLTISLGGSNQLSGGDNVTVNFTDSQGLSDGDEVDSTLNPQSTGGPTETVTLSGTTTTGEREIADVAVNDSDDVFFIRLVDNETGAILSVDDAEYRIQTPEPSDTTVRKLSALNVSDATVGEGYAIIDQDGDGNVTFGHTRLEPEQYYAQVSTTAPENSDIDEVGKSDNPSESFANIAEAAVGADGGDADAAVNASPEAFVFSPTANLTLSATEDRANATGSNLVDAPGFENSFDEDTGGTDADGVFKLTKLFTNFQVGENYTVIADKAGFATEFGEAFVTEDGAKFTDSPSQGLNLEPIPREADRVNITQVGTHPRTGPDPALVDRFDEVNEEPGDSEFQAIARDNQTYDIIRIDTADGQGPIGAETVVELEEYTNSSRFDTGNLTGEFVTVIGGSVVDDVSSNEDQIVIDTDGTNATFGVGDGTAFLVYFPTPSATETIDVNKRAQLRDDVTATDSSNATFVRTVVINETGSLSGIVTDNENQPLPSTTVYTEEFTVEDQQLTLEPSDPDTLADASDPLEVLNATWVITGPTGQSIERKGYNLTEEAVDRRFNVETELGVDATNGLTEASGLPTVSLAPPAENQGLTLLTFSSASASGQYTLPRVPADRSGNPVGATYEAVRAVQISPANTDFDGVGDSIAEGVQPNQTQEANVVIPFAEPLGVDVSIVDAPGTAEQGEQIDVTVELQNNNVVTSEDRTLTIELRDGSTAQIGSESVSLGPGETREVTVSAQVPADRETGDQQLAALTELAGELDQQAITIEEGNSSDLEAQFDGANGGAVDGEIEFDEVVAVINAFNDDSDDRVTEFGTVSDVIQAYNGDGQWPSSDSD